MFFRKKKNRSGTISVVVVDKHGGKFKELHTIGVAHDEQEADTLCEEGKRWINTYLYEFLVQKNEKLRESWTKILCYIKIFS